LPTPEPPKEYRWKKGQSGNPKGRPKKKTFQEYVEKELDVRLKKADGIEKRELLAKLWVDRLLKQKSKEDFTHYIKRVWPEIAKHEVRGDIDMNHEMSKAAEELEEMIRKSEDGDSKDS
jgi:predicted esterase YcpF (UPF0227 family)